MPKNHLNIMDRYIRSWKIYLLAILAAATGCKKFVQVDPPNNGLVSSTVYSNDITAAAAVTSIYNEMITNGAGFTSGANSISFEMGLYADELTNFSNDIKLSQFYMNSLNSQTITFWPEVYNLVYMCNRALEGLAASSGVSTALKQQLTGEAKFMRGFLFFYATNLYGSIPLVTSSSYQQNNSITRSSSTVVYQQVINDLLDAKSLLSDNYLDPSNLSTIERVRPNKGAAEAMLAKVYLYMGDWKSAESMADSVIGNSGQYNLVPILNDVFLKNSVETIWQLQSITPGYNTFDGYNFILTSPPGTPYQPVALSNSILNAFENGDNRFTNWIDSFVSTGVTFYYPYKYKMGDYLVGQPINEYLMVLRLAEQYLLRAEARAEQNNISGAQSDLNVIRSRAGLANTSANDKSSLITAIMHERQVELFTEWGSRWFDLKRTGTANGVMSIIAPQKGGAWSSNMQLLPIPQSDIVIDPNLTQNTGY